MVLRLVSCPMLEKSNKIGQLADGQKILLTARFRASLFLGFLTIRETGNFPKKFSGTPENFRNREILRNYWDSGSSVAREGGLQLSGVNLNNACKLLHHRFRQ